MTSVVYLEVRPSSTSDDFPSRMIIGNCRLIPIWRTISVTPFAIYKQFSDVIEPDMNIITCFTCDEYILEFKSKRFAQFCAACILSRLCPIFIAVCSTFDFLHFYNDAKR